MAQNRGNTSQSKSESDKTIFFLRYYLFSLSVIYLMLPPLEKAEVVLDRAHNVTAPLLATSGDCVGVSRWGTVSEEYRLLSKTRGRGTSWDTDIDDA